jgi:sigma-E factor negative regulatory protein RseC
MSDKLRETGIVSFVREDYAYLKTDAGSACGSCSSKKSCGSGRLFSLSNPDYTIRVPNRLNLQKGDEVILDMSSDKLLLGTVLIYLLPLLFLFLFASIGKYFGSEFISVLAGLSGLFIGLSVAKKIISIKKVARQFEPEVLERIVKVT